MVSRGQLLIGARYVNHDLLRNLILVDTPGAGDPVLVQELVRDFLPICDLILYFLSATSPLNTADLPVLLEKHSHLPFIPMTFVVTRADEFRRDRSLELSMDNFDQDKSGSFLSEVSARLNMVLQNTSYKPSDLVLVDNKTSGIPFGIPNLFEQLTAASDVERLDRRMNMHGHKINYFISNSESVKDHFIEFIQEKTVDLSNIVDTARENIDRFEASVGIRDSTLTETWHQHLETLRNSKEGLLSQLGNEEALPEELYELGSLPGAMGSFSTDINAASLSKARSIFQDVSTEVENQVSEQMDQEEERLLGLDSHAILPSVTLESGRVLLRRGLFDSTPPRFALRAADDLRSVVFRSLAGTKGTLGRRLDSIIDLMEQSLPLRAQERTIAIARTSLYSDIDTFFEIVELYRVAVFARQNKNSIARLGIGHELDKLEADFEDQNKENYKTNVGNLLFSDSAGISSRFTEQLSDLTLEGKSLREELSNVTVRHEQSDPRWLEEDENEAENELMDQSEDAVKGDVNDLLRDLQVKFSDQIKIVQEQYLKELRDLRAARNWWFARIILTTGGLFSLVYLGYVFLAPSVTPTLFVILALSVGANLLGDLIGLSIAKVFSRFPRRVVSLQQSFGQQAQQAFIRCRENTVAPIAFKTYSSEKTSDILARRWKQSEVDPEIRTGG
jgi:hypothetical protein